MNQPATKRPRSTLRWLLPPVYACHAALVWLLILEPPRVTYGIELDASWMRLIGFDFSQRIQAGVDFVFTYGPLGYFLVGSPSYLPDLFWERAIVDLGLRAFVVVAILSPVVRVPKVWQKLVYLAVVLLTAPIANDSFLLMAIAGSTISLILGERGLRFVLPAVVVFAALGMAKFTLFTLGAGTTALLMIGVWRRSGWRHGISVPLAFTSSFTLIWIFIGQSVVNLPAFFRGSMAIATGYNQSMRLHDEPSHVILALVAIGLTVFAAILVILRRPWNLRRTIALCVFAATVFLGWKLGFVRQDSGHELDFFCGAAVLPLWLWSFADEARRSPVLNVTALLATSAGFVGVFLIGGVGYDRPSDVFAKLVTQTRAHWNYVADLRIYRVQLDAMRLRAGANYRLPRIRAKVGGKPIDNIPHHQNILFLNHLNVRHRPIFQSYSAYSPYLQKLNGDFFESESRAPDFVLFKIEAIDRQFPTVSDSQVYRTLLRCYRPTQVEQDFLLLEKVAGVTSPKVSGQPGLRPIQNRTARLGEWVPLEPGEGLGELAIDLAFSRLGELWNFGFRGPALYLDVKLATGRVISDFVTSRGAMRLPFIVDPLILDTRAFIELYTGADSLPRVVAFRVRARGGRESLYASEFTLDFWRSNLPPGVDSYYPVFSHAPSHVSPEDHFELFWENGDLVHVARAPSELIFDRLRDVIEVSGRFGIRRAAYEGDRVTDGVTFRIERLDATGEAITVFERRLDPKNHEGDRDMHAFELSLQDANVEELVFRTLPGPDASRDWGFWTDLTFRKRGDPSNARDAPPSLSADVAMLSIQTGGAQKLTLDAGAGFANMRYVIAGSITGTQPGFRLFGMHIPLNPTGYTNLTLNLANTPALQGFRGRLDERGQATATIRLPAQPDATHSAQLYHAFVVYDDSGRIYMVSNPIGLALR